MIALYNDTKSARDSGGFCIAIENLPHIQTNFSTEVKIWKIKARFLTRF